GSRPSADARARSGSGTCPGSRSRADACTRSGSRPCADARARSGSGTCPGSRPSADACAGSDSGTRSGPGG
ncbi:hypothetical protein, partial [Azospirillum griseum]|uniref:hypothetical protein n=1 Tax=Azospirillum griseum TaxID=2496639 RepID=UPI001AECFD2B